MRKLTIPLLATSFLLLISCASIPEKNLAPGKTTTVLNPYFADPGKDYVYRTKINVYGNELNGILIAKKINDSVHRVVLATDFGNTLLDMEIGQNSFRKNSIVDDLDRKIIVNTLRDDFRLMLRERFACSQAVLAGDRQMLYDVIGESNPLQISTSDSKLISISNGNARKRKVSIGFESENNIFADKITIQHYNIKLSIEMRQIAR